MVLLYVLQAALNTACVGSHNKDSNYSFIVIPRHDEENSTWLSHTNWEAYFLDWV